MAQMLMTEMEENHSEYQHQIDGKFTTEDISHSDIPYMNTNFQGEIFYNGDNFSEKKTTLSIKELLKSSVTNSKSLNAKTFLDTL